MTKNSCARSVSDLKVSEKEMCVTLLVNLTHQISMWTLVNFTRTFCVNKKYFVYVIGFDTLIRILDCVIIIKNSMRFAVDNDDWHNKGRQNMPANVLQICIYDLSNYIIVLITDSFFLRLMCFTDHNVACAYICLIYYL